MKKDKQRGITLVALVVTIIILLILAGVSIAQLTGNGLFEKAKLAKEKSDNAQIEENIILGEYENLVENYIETSRDKTDYCTTPAGTTSTASITSPCVVIENYRNGTQFYRVWSDGWIEQGGYSTGGANATGNEIKLLKNYNNTNYTLVMSDAERVRSNAAAFSSVITQKNIDNFYVSSSYVTNSGWAYSAVNFYWYACGY